MGALCLQNISRLYLQLSLHGVIQRILVRNRTLGSIARSGCGVTSPLCTSRLQINSFQRCWQHTETKELHSFPLYRRIPKRYMKEIENVVETNRDKIVKFASVFNCDVSLVEELVRKDTRIVTCFNVDDVIQKMQLVKSYGYGIRDLISYFPIFYRTVEELTERLDRMKEVRKVSTILRPACMTRSQYRQYMEQMEKDSALVDGYPSRDSYVAALLGCSEAELKEMAEKPGNYHLLTRRPSHLTELVEILKSYGLTLDEIRQNPGVLNTSIKMASKRLQYLSELDLILKEHIVFIVTTSSSNFKSVLPNWIEEKKVLGPHRNRREYLMHRLSINEQQFEMMLKRAKMIDMMNARRLKHVLDVLMDEMGLLSEDIQMNPNLLYYSSERLSLRWKILQDAGVLSKKSVIKELRLNEEDFSAKYFDTV